MAPKDVAERYGVKACKVLAWINAGELTAINTATRRGGKPRWKIRPEALAAFEASRSSRPAPAIPKRRKRTAEPGEIVFFT